MRFPLAVLAANLALALSCHQAPAPIAGLDPATAACIPADTAALVSLDLVRLRSAPAYATLPAAAIQLLAPYASASRLLIAWGPNAVLLLARGTFSQPPTGATLVTPNLSIAGPDDAVHAAIARYRARTAPASALLANAAGIAGSSALWIVVRGGLTLPLSGNAANLNRLFLGLDYAGLALDFDSPAQLRVVAQAAAPQNARQFEESLRAFLSLAALGEARRPDLVALLESVRIERRDRTATATLRAPPDALVKLLAAFAR